MRTLVKSVECAGEQFAEVIALPPELASSDLAKLTFEARRIAPPKGPSIGLQQADFP